MSTPSTAKPSFHLTAARAPLRGEARVPGDKSIGHRAVMFAAMAAGRSAISGLSGGEDNQRTVAAFRALGVAITDGGRGELGQSLTVEGVGLDGLRASVTPLDCGNSGTTMRLLAGVLAPTPFASTLVGDEYLHARPMGRVAEPLLAMGAHITGRSGKKLGEIYAPLVVGPATRRLRGIEFASPIASAQVKTAVILAALHADGTTLYSEPSTSRDHTERMLQAMGAPIRVAPDRIVVTTHGWGRELRACDFVVPGDLSSAAFLIGAALLVPGSVVTLRGVCVNPTRTGVLDVLRAMGAQLSVHAIEAAPGAQAGEPTADIVAYGSRLAGTRVSGALTVRALDEIPLIAALAAHAEGTTVIEDAGELRVKESDRIAAMTAALAAMGVRVEERPDGMVIHGGAVRGGEVVSHGDHRIAMASAVCGLAASGETRIADVENVATSFPSFVTTLARLGAPIDVR